MKVIVMPNGKWYGPYPDEEEARRTADYFEERGQVPHIFTDPDSMTWKEAKAEIERIVRKVFGPSAQQGEEE
jgi:hypothetical protein